MCASGESVENWLSGLVASPSRLLPLLLLLLPLNYFVICQRERLWTRFTALSLSFSLSLCSQQPVCACILFFPPPSQWEKKTRTLILPGTKSELPSSSPLLLLYLRPCVISDIPPSFTRTKRGPRNIYNNLCRTSDAAVTPSPWNSKAFRSASSAYCCLASKGVCDFTNVFSRKNRLKGS